MKNEILHLNLVDRLDNDWFKLSIQWTMLKLREESIHEINESSFASMVDLKNFLDEFIICNETS